VTAAARVSARVSDHPAARGVSYNQEQICLLSAFYPGNKAYNAQATTHVHGELDPRRLERAVSRVVARHQVLRTTISLGDDGYRATVHDPYHFVIPVHDLSGLPDADRRRALDALRRRRQDRVFDLETLPLLSLDAVRLGPAQWQLIQVEHHAVHDGWSFGRFWAEVQAGYAEPPAALAPVPAQYQQFVSWQRDRMAGEYGREAIDFWSRYLDEAADVTVGRGAALTDRLDGHNLETTVPADVFDRIRDTARRLAVSPFVLMFSVYARMLAERSGSTDFCVGTAVNARTEPELEPMIGMVVNTVPVRVTLRRDELPARAVQRSLFRALRYSDVPLSLIVRRLKLAQKRGRNPVFQHCFSFHDSQVPRLSLGGVAATIHEEQNQTAKFDMNIVVIPPSETRTTGHGRMFWQFSRSVFTRSEAQAFARDYERLLVETLSAS
jgi:condensation domain-containing protein